MPESTDSRQRLRVDADRLNRLVEDRSLGATRGAEEWRRVLHDTGLLGAILAARGGGDPVLIPHLERIGERLSVLERAEGGVERVGADSPEGAATERSVLLIAFAGLGLIAATAGGTWAGVMALVAIALVVGARRWRLSAAGARRVDAGRAREGLANAVRAFLGQTWVAPVGGRVLECTPRVAALARELSELEDAIARGAEHARGLVALRERVLSANARLGRASEDAETQALTRQQVAVETGLVRAQALREGFEEQLQAARGRVELLRLIAERRMLSDAVAEAVGADGGEAAAAGEVSAVEVDAQLRALGDEVVQATQELAATLEVSALTLSRQ